MIYSLTCPAGLDDAQAALWPAVLDYLLDGQDWEELSEEEQNRIITEALNMIQAA
jgi:hypothetical protein